MRAGTPTELWAQARTEEGLCHDPGPGPDRDSLRANCKNPRTPSHHGDVLCSVWFPLQL